MSGCSALFNGPSMPGTRSNSIPDDSYNVSQCPTPRCNSLSGVRSVGTSGIARGAASASGSVLAGATSVESDLGALSTSRLLNVPLGANMRNVSDVNINNPARGYFGGLWLSPEDKERLEKAAVEADAYARHDSQSDVGDDFHDEEQEYADWSSARHR